jgi:uncharacterized protein (UPF0248 family)
MQLNGFSVEIPESIEETSQGYVVLKHGEHFRIKLNNHHKKDRHGKSSDAEVYLQGKFIGCYRIEYGETLILERSFSDSGKFTAYRNGTPEADQAEINPDSPDNGLIKVVWKPGTKKHHYEIVNPDIGTGEHYLRAWIKSIETYPVRYSDNTSSALPLYYDSTTDGGYHFFNCSTSCCAKSHTTRSCNELTGGGIGLSDHSDQKFTETESLDYSGEGSTTMYLRISFRNEEPRPINTVVYKTVTSTSIPRPLK